MNMQAMLKQAQQMQKDMMEKKAEIDAQEFVFENEVLIIKMMGDKRVVSVKIKIDPISNEDREIMEDIVMVAINKLMDDIDKETDAKLGKYTQAMPGVF